jgi:hypothetical protein
MDQLIVCNVQGRYPHGPAKLHSDNMEVEVEEVARVFRLRVDDLDNPDFWMEIVIELSTEEAMPCTNLNGHTHSRSD